MLTRTLDTNGFGNESYNHTYKCRFEPRKIASIFGVSCRPSTQFPTIHYHGSPVELCRGGGADPYLVLNGMDSVNTCPKVTPVETGRNNRRGILNRAWFPLIELYFYILPIFTVRTANVIVISLYNRF